MNRIPKKIYLQIRDEDGKVLDSKINEAVTWCADQINDNDEPYIRHSLLEKAIANIKVDIGCGEFLNDGKYQDGLYHALGILHKYGLK